MRSGQSGALRVISLSRPPPEAEPDYARDIYQEARVAALDSERWRRMHVRSQRSAPISLGERIRRLTIRGGGTRRERGGYKFEEMS